MQDDKKNSAGSSALFHLQNGQSASGAVSPSSSSPPLPIADLKKLVRTIPDYPKPGIMFRDITTLMGDAAGFYATMVHLAEMAKKLQCNAIAGIEARGFIFGGALALQLGCGFIPVRKKGKLPCDTISVDYDLEYGTDSLEIDPKAISAGQNILLVDDLLATGGTANAAATLIRQAGGAVDHALFVIDLPILGGAKNLAANHIESHFLMAFDGE